MKARAAAGCFARPMERLAFLRSAVFRMGNPPPGMAWPLDSADRLALAETLPDGVRNALVPEPLALDLGNVKHSTDA